jgi:two-component system sensor histidine kinase AlgZ
LVENAVVHGLAGHQGPVTVSLTVSLEKDRLIMTVRNTIAPDKAPGGHGIGLRNVRERLAVQFEDRALLSAESHGAEWISEISMPAIRESPAREVRHAAVLVEA